jgi:hypothetical protein
MASFQRCGEKRDKRADMETDSTYQKMETQNFEDILEATKQPDFAGSAVTM